MLELAVVVFAWMAILAGVVGAIWIAILAFQDDQPIWGVACLLCFLAALIYGVMRFDDAKIPLGLLGIGVITRMILQFVKLAVT